MKVGTTGPQPRRSDPSGSHRASTTSDSSQWAQPDLNRERYIVVGATTVYARKNFQIDVTRVSKHLPHRLPDVMPKRMPEHVPERMSE